MPLRKQGAVLAATAATLLIATPGAAQASKLSSLLSGKKSSTTKTTAAGAGSVTSTATTTPAQATSPAVPAPANCQQLPTTKAFQGVDGDGADYSVAPGGNFEDGSPAWTLENGARIVSGNESLGVSPGAKALVMPSGATATSPEFCIDDSHPSFRFAYKVDNSALTGFVALVLYRDSSGQLTNVELTSSKSISFKPSAWQASPASPLATLVPLSVANRSATVQLKILSLAPTDVVAGGVASGAFNFAAKIASAVSTTSNFGVTIDSVMVDPYRTR